MVNPISWAISLLRKEWATISRFVLVGGSTVLLKIGLYTLLSRYVWVEGPNTIENVMALVTAQVYNYFSNRYWTFGHQEPAPGSLKRYLTVFAFGAAADASLFYVGHEIFKVYDLIVIVFVTGLVSMFTFVTHRLFTFHADPYKRRTDVVQSA
ncbi:MAG: GtrA family protein [Patescibacteria group bacterium]